MSYIIATYKITYLDYNISQLRNLVLHEDFIKYYKPIKDKIYCLEEQLYGLNKKKHKDKIISIETEIQFLKNKLKKEFGDFFTTKSPLFESIDSGILVLPECQGGQHRVEFKRIQ